MKKYLWPLSGLMVTVLAGGAVMVGPFALHLNPGGHWTSGTETMFWSGVGLVVVGLLGLMLWQRELTGEMRVAQAQLQPEEVSMGPGQEPGSIDDAGEEPAKPDWETELSQLADAVLRDLKAESESPAAEPAEPPPEDLQAVASALLRDLSQRMDRVGTGSGQGGRY